jgi:hypothetical protein
VLSFGIIVPFSGVVFPRNEGGVLQLAGADFVGYCPLG